LSNSPYIIMEVNEMTIYLVEVYPVKRNRMRKYRAVMRRIHRNLRQHRRDVPELLSYKTLKAGRERSLTRFVELFEFRNQQGMNRFFGRFPKTQWLKTLQQDFFEVVPRRTMQVSMWGEFFSDEWFTH
jgi:hypothetical protein